MNLVRLKLKQPFRVAGLAALAFSSSIIASADVVTDWNVAFENSLTVPAERGPRVPVRTLAIMHVAMFDAVNSIERKYQPCVVRTPAPVGARADAAAIQAAYTVLKTLLPAHLAAYDAQLEASLQSLAGQQGNSQSLARGREWGESVAQAIIAARATDGSTTILPPFVGSTEAGYWRHAPFGASPTAGYPNLATTPFVISNPMAFDPGPPYGVASRAEALKSAAYAADVNEVKDHGGAVSTLRTPAELDEALYIDACDVAALNHVLRDKQHPDMRLVDSAREFALLNTTAFDTTVVFFRMKYQYALWRPIQAIKFANEDENTATTPDLEWGSRLPTPPHPEYPSAHVTLFTALLSVIARLEGDAAPVSVTAAASTAHPGGTRVFPSLGSISDAAVEARINVGYHFRDTCETSQVLGRAIGDYMVDHALLLRSPRN